MAYSVCDLEEMKDSWQGDGMFTDAQAVEKWLDEREKRGYSMVGVIPEYHAYNEHGELLGTRDPMIIMHRPEVGDR